MGNFILKEVPWWGKLATLVVSLAGIFSLSFMMEKCFLTLGLAVDVAAPILFSFILLISFFVPILVYSCVQVFYTVPIDNNGNPLSGNKKH